MSLKNPRYLLIISAVIVALLAGTALLASYTNILPARFGTGSQAQQAYPATSQRPWCLAQNSPRQIDEVCCPAKFCPDECENCCCPDECDKCRCPKNCPCDCTKPCSEGESAPDCCPMSDTSAAAKTACCPKANTATE